MPWSIRPLLFNNGKGAVARRVWLWKDFVLGLGGSQRIDWRAKQDHYTFRGSWRIPTCPAHCLLSPLGMAKVASDCWGKLASMHRLLCKKLLLFCQVLVLLLQEISRPHSFHISRQASASAVQERLHLHPSTCETDSGTWCAWWLQSAWGWEMHMFCLKSKGYHGLFPILLACDGTRVLKSHWKGLDAAGLEGEQ